MFEQLREDRANAVMGAQHAASAAEAALASAQTQLAAAQAQLAWAQAALTAAEDAAAQAATARDQAQVAVDQRQADVNSRASALDAAVQARDLIADNEPENPLPNGKPNPNHPGWVTRLAAANQAVADCQAALGQAQSALNQATQARDAATVSVASATAAVQSAQNTVTIRSQAVASAQDAVASAKSQLATRQQAIAAAQAALSAVDARQARLLALPLNRADLEAAAEIEISDLQATRDHRHDQLHHRATATAQRSDLRTQQAQDLAALPSVRDAIAGWAESGHFPGLAAVQSALAAAIASDDPDVISPSVVQARSALEAVVLQAANERSQRDAELAAAAKALADHQEVQP